MSKSDTRRGGRTVYKTIDDVRAPARIRIDGNCFSVVERTLSTDIITEYKLIKAARYSLNPWTLRVNHYTREVKISPVHDPHKNWKHIPDLEIVRSDHTRARQKHDSSVDPLGLDGFPDTTEVQ